MVGLVVATHGRLAEELVSTAEGIVGKLPAVATCTVQPGASLETIREMVREAVRSVDSGEGVLVFADLCGGTPCTLSLTLSRQLNLEVLTGVNLPMLLKAASLRSEHMPLPDLACALIQYGQRNITCASATLRDGAAAGNHRH
ncbi:MAG: PTS sugar transporter subunit IIA [Myxococcaceae bacterium]